MSDWALQSKAGSFSRISHLVTADSYLPHSGGSRVYYAELYKALLAQYPDTVTMLTKKVPGWRAYDRMHSSVNFRIWRRFQPLPNWKYWQLPRAIPQLMHAAAMVATGHYDCLHCGDLFPQGLNGVALRMMFRLPLLVFCHGDELSQTDKRRYQPKVRDFVYRHADALVAANEFARQGLLRIGIPSERIYKLTPGVDLGHFYPAPRNEDLVRRYGLSQKKVLLTVARLVPRKGHKVVLQALPTVLKDIPDVHYVIAGDGPEKTKLQNLVRDLNLNHAVTFAGDVPHERIGDFYNLCDVFIMVNRLELGGDVESFGMVFTEANAAGKPVIGGNSGGAAEAIVDGVTGYLVDSDSVEQVANRITRLFANPELCRSLGATGLSRVRAEFNWDSRARRLREICAHLVGQPVAQLPDKEPSAAPEETGMRPNL